MKHYDSNSLEDLLKAVPLPEGYLHRLSECHLPSEESTNQQLADVTVPEFLTEQIFDASFDMGEFHQHTHSKSDASILRPLRFPSFFIATTLAASLLIAVTLFLPSTTNDQSPPNSQALALSSSNSLGLLVPTKSVEQYDIANDDLLPSLTISVDHPKSNNFPPQFMDRISAISERSFTFDQAIPPRLGPLIWHEAADQLSANQFLVRWRPLGARPETTIPSFNPPEVVHQSSWTASNFNSSSPWDRAFYRRERILPFISPAVESPNRSSLQFDTRLRLSSEIDSFETARQQLRAGKTPDPRTIKTEQFITALANFDSPKQTGSSDQAILLKMRSGKSIFSPELQLVEFSVKSQPLSKLNSAAEYEALDLTIAIHVTSSLIKSQRWHAVLESLSLIPSQLKKEDRVELIFLSESFHQTLTATASTQTSSWITALNSISKTPSFDLPTAVKLVAAIALEKKSLGTLTKTDTQSSNNGVLFLSDQLSGDSSLESDFCERLAVDLQANHTQLELVSLAPNLWQSPAEAPKHWNHLGQVHLAQSDRKLHLLFSQFLRSTRSQLPPNVNLEIDWNPEVVLQYRMLGYKNPEGDLFTSDQNSVTPCNTSVAMFEILTKPSSSGKIATAKIAWANSASKDFKTIEKSLYQSQSTQTSIESQFGLQISEISARIAEHLQGSFFSRKRGIDLQAIEQTIYKLKSVSEPDSRLLVLEHLLSELKGAKID